MTAAEYNKQYKRAKKAREGKYNAHKVVRSYGTFDSVHEHNTYLNLLDSLKKGLIKDLHRQVEFELIPAQYETVQKKLKTKTVERNICIEKKCSYYADFTYYDDTGNFHVLDSKGMKTEVYRIKKKLMLWRHGIKIEEV